MNAGYEGTLDYLDEESFELIQEPEDADAFVRFGGPSYRFVKRHSPRVRLLKYKVKVKYT